MNEKSFEYTSHYGTVFKSDRCDFKGGVWVTHQPAEKFFSWSDVTEMIGYHATNIHPQLNGFQGYDCVQWHFEK